MPLSSCIFFISYVDSLFIFPDFEVVSELGNRFLSLSEESNR